MFQLHSCALCDFANMLLLLIGRNHRRDRRVAHYQIHLPVMSREDPSPARTETSLDILVGDFPTLLGNTRNSAFNAKRRGSLEVNLLSHHWMKIRRVIGTAHQRAGRDMLEAFFTRDFTQEIELFRRDIFDHWQMPRIGPEILPHC